MRLFTLFILFFLQSIITAVEPEVSPCAEKKLINNLPETRSLNYLGIRRPGLVVKGTPDYTNGNTGQIHGTGGSPNGGSGIIHGGNDILINNKLIEQSGHSKNNLISQRLSNLVHKHGLGIRGGAIGSINHSQLNVGPGSHPGLSSTNSVVSATPNSNVQTGSAGGSGLGGSQSSSSGGLFSHAPRPHHSLHGIGALGGNLHHSHYLNHHGGIGSHFSSQGVGSTGHHHFGQGGFSSINGGAGLLGLGQTQGQHHGGLGLLQGGSTSSVNGGAGGLLGLSQTNGYHHGGLSLLQGGSTSSVNGGAGGLLGLGQTNGYHHGGLGLIQGGSLNAAGGGVGGGIGHRPHLGGLGLIHSNNGNQLSGSNNNLLNVGSQAINSRPTQGHGGLLGWIQNRPGVGSGIFQSTGGGNSQILGHNGGLGLIHSSHAGNSGTSGNTNQYGGGTHFGQQGQQGTFTVHGGPSVAAPNYQSSGNGVNTVQISNQQNLQQGGLSYAGMSSQGQSTGSNGGGGGVFYGYHRPQGVVYQVHWSQPGGYSTTGGLASGNTQYQSHQGSTSGVSSESINKNLNGNLNQGSQLHIQNGYNNQLGSQNTNQGFLWNGGANQAQQGTFANNLSNSLQTQGGNQFSNNANINYAGSNSGSSGSNNYGLGVSQSHGSLGQEYNSAGGQNIGASHGISTGSTSNASGATQVQGSNSQTSSFGGGFASGSSTAVGTSQTQGTSSQSLNTQSGIHTGTSNGQLTGNGYDSGSSGNTNTHGSGTTAQTQGSNGQYYVPNGIYGTNVGNLNSLSQSSNANLESQGNSGSQGSTFVSGNHLSSNAGHIQSSAHGLGTQQSQGSGSQQYNTAGGYHTGMNAGLSGTQFQNVGTSSQIQGNGGQSSSVVGGYFTGTNSDSSFATSSVSQTQGSSNLLSSTASENYISSNKGPSGTSSYGSNSQTQSEVSNATASSTSAAGGGAHSSTNSYGGSFLVASQGQPTNSQSSAWSHKQPVNQPGGSLTFEGNLNVIGSQGNTNLNSGVGNIQNAVFSDEYIDNDSEGQSAQAGTGSAISGSSGSFVANGNISGDKQSHASGSLGSSTSLSENQPGQNSAGIESGIYHVGSTGNAGTTGQYSPSQPSTSGESITHSENSQLQQGAQSGLSSQSSGSHGSEVGLGGSSTNKETTNVQGSPGYNSGFSIVTSNSNKPQSSGFSQGSSGQNLSGGSSHSGETSQTSEGSIGSTGDASHSSNLVSNSNSNLGNNLVSGTGFSPTSNLSGMSGSNIAENYGTSVNSQSSSSHQNVLSVNSNKESNNRPYASSTENNENTSGSGIYSSSNLGGSGTSSQSSIDGLSLSSGAGNNIMNNLNTHSNVAQTNNVNHLNQQEAGSNTDSSITGSNNFQPSQNTGGSSSSHMSFGGHQNHNTENTGNLNYNQGTAGGSVNNNQMIRPNGQQSASLSSGSNTQLGIQENYSSNLESSDKNGVHVSGNNQGGTSQFSGSNSNNAQYTRPGTSGSGVYENEGNVGLNNKNPNTFSSSITSSGQASGSNHGTFSSNQLIGPTNQWSSGASSSQNTQGVNSLQGNMGLHNQGQYSETNNIEQSFTSKPTYGGSSSVEAGSLVYKEQQSEGGTGDINHPTTSSGNSQLSSTSSTSLEGNGNQIGSTTINNQEGYGSNGFVAGTGSQNQNGGNLIASGSSESDSSIHTQGELHGGLGASTNKQSQASLQNSHYVNPIQYSERYIFVPEMISHNIDTSRVDGHETENIQHAAYAVVHTEHGSYLVKNLPPALGTGQAMKNRDGETFHGYYVHDNFPHGPQIDQMTTSFTPAHFIDNSQLSHSQGSVGVNQHSSGVTGQISGHLGKQGNFQGLLSIPSRIVGVLSGVGNSLGGFVSHGINGGFQGNAEHSGEVSFEGGFNHYPVISGSIHGNFENHVSGSGSVEGSGERKLT